MAGFGCSDDGGLTNPSHPGTSVGGGQTSAVSSGTSGTDPGHTLLTDAAIGDVEASLELVPDAAVRATDAAGVSIVPDPVAGGWQLNEFAKIVDGALQLTPGIDDMNGHERGTAFWPMALASDGLAIQFDAEIIPTPQRFHGDGMTLALGDVAAGAKPTDFGDSGGGLGYSSAPCCSGIKGIAVALDTSKNANDPSANFLGVATGGQIDRIDWAVTKTEGVPTWTDAKHRIGVTIAGGVLAVSIDNSEILRTTEGTPPIPKQVLIGFTAANGSNKSRHLVTRFAVSRL